MEWEADPHAIVAHMVRRQMREVRASLGLPLDRALWPSPEQLPTLCCVWAYRVTRDMERERSLCGRRRFAATNGKEAIPWTHATFMTSAHANEFVHRQGILEIRRGAPGPKPRSPAP